MEARIQNVCVQDYQRHSCYAETDRPTVQRARDGLLPSLQVLRSTCSSHSRRLCQLTTSIVHAIG